MRTSSLICWLKFASEGRKQKLWALSDQIRDKLKSLGVTIEDSADLTSWRWLSFGDGASS